MDAKIKIRVERMDSYSTKEATEALIDIPTETLAIDVFETMRVLTRGHEDTIRGRARDERKLMEDPDEVPAY